MFVELFGVGHFCLCTFWVQGIWVKSAQSHEWNDARKIIFFEGILRSVCLHHKRMLCERPHDIKVDDARSRGELEGITDFLHRRMIIPMQSK